MSRAIQITSSPRVLGPALLFQPEERARNVEQRTERSPDCFERIIRLESKRETAFFLNGVIYSVRLSLYPRRA